MPELPEVQTVVDDLQAAGVEGSTIYSAAVTWENTVRPLTALQFSKEVCGRRIESIRRRGKYIVFKLDRGAYLLTHLRMTGQYQLSPPEKEADPHVRVEFKLDQDFRLRFHDTRKFGRIIFTHCPGEILDKLGPDPFDPELTPDKFASAVHKHARRIKALLLDQSFLAGLGNIYCDEALFAAGVHPLENSRLIEPYKAEKLLLQIRTVLRQGLRNRGTSLGEGETNYISGGKRGENREALRVYGLKGRPCPRCGTPLEKIYVAQRGSYFCPRCQTRSHIESLHQESSSK